MRTRFWSNRDFLTKQSYIPFYFYILLFFVIVVSAVTLSQFSLHSSSCPPASASQAAIKVYATMPANIFLFLNYFIICICVCMQA